VSENWASASFKDFGREAGYERRPPLAAKNSNEKNRAGHTVAIPDIHPYHL
jgi:hypothetical protein